MGKRKEYVKVANKNGKQGEGGGQPPIVLDEKLINQIEALASVLTKEQLVDYLGISENTFRAIEGRQPEVLAAYKRGQVKSVIRVGETILSKAIGGDMLAAKFYMAHRGGWVDTTKASVDVTSKGKRLKPNEAPTIVLQPISANKLKEQGEGDE